MNEVGVIASGSGAVTALVRSEGWEADSGMPYIPLVGSDDTVNGLAMRVSPPLMVHPSVSVFGHLRYGPEYGEDVASVDFSFDWSSPERDSECVSLPFSAFEMATLWDVSPEGGATGSVVVGCGTTNVRLTHEMVAGRKSIRFGDVAIAYEDIEAMAKDLLSGYSTALIDMQILVCPLLGQKLEHVG